ncbi:MAG: hypothetical protein CW716_03110, partial [Candidatus Bathyarchaeum sp.]
NRKGLMFFSTLPGGTFYAWGAQIEKGSEARSYVPTTDGPSSPFDTLYLQNADGSVSANLNLDTLNCDLIAYADGKTRLARMADGVVAVQSFVDDTWFAGTLDASNVFVDHIMSLSGEGIFAVDVLRLHCNSPQLSNAQMVKEVYWFADGVFSPVEPPAGTSFPGSPSSGDLFNRTDEGLFYQYDGSTWVPLGSNLGKLPTGLSPLQLKDNESNNFANIFLTISSDNYDAPIITTDQSVLVKKDISAGGFLGSNQGAVMLGSGLTSQVDDPKIMLMNSAVSRLQGGGPLGLPAVPSGSSLPGGVNGKLFVLTTDQHLYKHNGTTWVDIGPTSDYAGNFDTLHITQSDGSIPANLNLGSLTANDHIHLKDSSSLITRQQLLDHLYKVGQTPDEFDWGTIPQYLEFYNQSTGISAYMFCPSLSDGYNEPVLYWNRALAVRKDIITGGRLDSMEGVVSLLGGVGWGPDGYNSNPFIWLVGNQHGYPSKDTLEIRTSTYSGGWIWSWGNIAAGEVTANQVKIRSTNNVFAVAAGDNGLNQDTYLIPLNPSEGGLGLGTLTYPFKWVDATTVLTDAINGLTANNDLVITPADEHKVLVDGDLEVTGNIIGQVSQGGEKGSDTTDANGEATITFGDAFDSMPLVFVQAIDASGRSIIIDVTAKSTTQFSVKAKIAGVHKHKIGEAAATAGWTIGISSEESHTHNYASTTGVGSSHRHSVAGTTGLGSAHNHAYASTTGVATVSLDSTPSAVGGNTNTVAATGAGHYHGFGQNGGAAADIGHSHGTHTHNFSSYTGDESSHTHYYSQYTSYEGSHTHNFSGTSGEGSSHGHNLTGGIPAVSLSLLPRGINMRDSEGAVYGIGSTLENEAKTSTDLYTENSVLANAQVGFDWLAIPA